MTNTISKIIHNGDEFEFDTSSVSGITTTQPSNPSEGAMYYDTTNDVVKVYDGTNWNVVGDDAADINTKTFYLSSRSDLTTAQAALDWYLADKNPIIVYDKTAYMVYVYNSHIFGFATAPTYGKQYQNSCTETFFGSIILEILQGTVTNIIINESTIQRVLSTDVNYSTPYTPAYNGSPATKKYVDDTVASAKSSGSTAPSNPAEGQLWYDTTNDVLKVYDGTNWVEVGGGEEPNVKVFTISGEGDTTTGQQIYDYYTAGKGVLVRWGNILLKVARLSTAGNAFNMELSSGLFGYSDSTSYSHAAYYYLTISGSNGVVNSVVPSSGDISYLSVFSEYTTPYIPEYDGSPATKKYVDDSASVVSGDSGTTYTIKVSNFEPDFGTPNSTITFVI